MTGAIGTHLELGILRETFVHTILISHPLQVPADSPSLVIYCSSPAWGGLEHMVVRLADWLTREEGIPTLVLCVPNTQLHQKASALGIATEGIRNRKYVDFVAAFRLTKLLRQRGYPPVLIAHNKDLDVASWAHRFAGGRFALWYWQHMMIGVPKKGLFQRVRQARLTGWLAPLPYLKAEAIEKTIVPQERIFIAPPGIDTTYFVKTLGSPTELRQQLGLPKEAFLLGIIGRFDPQKGQDFAIRALPLLPTDMHLVLMGEATRNEKGVDYGETLKILTADLGLKDRVHFIPFSPETPSFYQAMDLVLMNTVGETYGLVTVEALASGVPVLGTYTGGTIELLGDGAFGYFYEARNQASYVSQIEHIAQHVPEAKAKALAGQALVVELRSKQVLVNQIKSLVLRPSFSA